ncbi:MAG TPA: glucose 1-dehydrogenase [Caulobacteraceae bacterium]|jgi:2-deoxy-D-gluconate 3-dehydrogenase|nr:glucose 1-dehydrogenase [Caulobacteraceae bacterium]
MPSFDLTGRVAFVTGGNGGIGLGIAKGLADAGAKVVVAARNAEKSKAAVAELGALAEAVSLDVTDEAACRAAIAETAARHGRLDILVNNAGVSVAKPPQSLSLTDWNAVVGANLTACFICAQAAYAPMKAGGGGKIINIGSMYSIFGNWYSAAYSASKGGLVQLTKSLAVAWARENIQVNAILPGWIETDMTRDAKAGAEFDAAILARTPAHRWGQPEDFAGPAVFLASAASDFVTGHSLAVDGGFAVQG